MNDNELKAMLFERMDRYTGLARTLGYRSEYREERRRYERYAEAIGELIETLGWTIEWMEKGDNDDCTVSQQD